MAFSKRGKRWLIFLALAAGALVTLQYSKDVLAASALRSVAQAADKAGHHVTFEGVRVSLTGGHIRINELDVVPLADSTLEDSTVRYTMHADAIELNGVDLWALIRQKVLHVERLELNGPSVSHSFITRVIPPTKLTVGHDTSGQAQSALSFFSVDTLRITNATGSSQDRAQTNPAFAVADLDLLVTGIVVQLDAQGKPLPEVDRIQLALHKAEAHLKPYYALSLDSMRVRVPEDTALIFGLRFTPEVDPKEYHRQVKTQVELYKATVDTIMLTGFDLAAKLHSGSLRARKLYLSGVAVDIHRDKSIPDIAPKKEKRLAAERMSAWKVPVAMDTVSIRRGSVTYHERLKRGDDYGSIAFTDITGVLTGISNEPTAHPPDLHLVGTARVGSAKAELDVFMPMQSEHTTVTAHVVLRDFPAKAMNRMTDDLLHVSATNGMVHLIDMHMKGDDDRGGGTLDMQYQDLEMEIGTEIDHAKIFSALANTVVRGSNMPGTNGYRQGYFTVERPMDAGLFKYIWISLRTGMMEVVLPKAVLNQLKKQQAKKKAPAEGPKKEKKGLFRKKD